MAFSILAFDSNRKTLKKSWRNKGDRDALLLERRCQSLG
jgi:hypothetical protein